MADVRIERDSMGEMQVPADALWGPQTQRAVENFPISGHRVPRSMIRALGLVKRAAAGVNADLGLLDKNKAEAIRRACDEVIDGKLDSQFPVDIFQTGSGTSSNMNTNEVVAHRASALLDSAVHPNDDVNMGQSSNDVIPTAIHVAAVEQARGHLIPALGKLQAAFVDKSQAFDDIVKIGRTHLQDATPVRLGQEFGGYAAMMELGAERVERGMESLLELAIGGTAVGTGINTHPDFPQRMVNALSESTGISFRVSRNHFESLATRDAAVELSGELRTVAVSLHKIVNDLRWLGSGPRAGLGELKLPAVQPGSSIMPGKVNPVIPESVAMVVAQVIGNDAAIGFGGAMGNFELNVMKPVIAHNLLESIQLLRNACHVLCDRCVAGIDADRERIAALVEQNIALATALAPRIGYDKAAEIAKKAWAQGSTVREVAQDVTDLSADELGRILDARSLTDRGIPG